MIPKMPALGLDPRVETGFRIRSCTTMPDWCRAVLRRIVAGVHQAAAQKACDEASLCRRHRLRPASRRARRRGADALSRRFLARAFDRALYRPLAVRARELRAKPAAIGAGGLAAQTGRAGGRSVGFAP